MTTNHYGKEVPKHAHGTANLDRPTSSARQIMDAVLQLYDRIVDRRLLVRRIYVTANHVTDECLTPEQSANEQLSLFVDYEALERQRKAEAEALEKERKLQEAVLDIKKKFGKNAVLRGMSLQEGATARQRNEQIGGHRA